VYLYTRVCVLRWHIFCSRSEFKNDDKQPKYLRRTHNQTHYRIAHIKYISFSILLFYYLFDRYSRIVDTSWSLNSRFKLSVEWTLVRDTCTMNFYLLVK